MQGVDSGYYLTMGQAGKIGNRRTDPDPGHADGSNAIDDILGIRIKRIQKTIKKNKEKLYRGVNQGDQRAISTMSKLYFWHFLGLYRVYLSSPAPF